ncbi:hypothetical protein Tco_1485238 [Tanacetum coccineum]
MEAGTTSTNLTTKLPILNPGDYDLWLMRIEQYFRTTDYSFWEVIKNGNKVLKRTVGETEPEYKPTTVEEKQDRRNEMKARGMETNIHEKDKKKAKQQNQARDGKDKVKSKPKSVKVRKSTPTKSKVNQVKKIQLEGLNCQTSSCITRIKRQGLKLEIGGSIT